LLENSPKAYTELDYALGDFGENEEIEQPLKVRDGVTASSNYYNLCQQLGLVKIIPKNWLATRAICWKILPKHIARSISR